MTNSLTTMGRPVCHHLSHPLAAAFSVPSCSFSYPGPFPASCPAGTLYCVFFTESPRRSPSDCPFIPPQPPAHAIHSQCVPLAPTFSCLHDISCAATRSPAQYSLSDCSFVPTTPGPCHNLLPTQHMRPLGTHHLLRSRSLTQPPTCHPYSLL
jgi:hypothetical protein